MTHLAAILLPAWATVPVACVGSILLLFYFVKLGDDGVPPSRRRNRRFSISVTLIAMPVLVYALSGADHATTPRAFVIAWSGVMAAIFIVVMTALIDVLISMRLHRERRRATIDLARRQLIDAAMGRAEPDTDA